jgi:hypothetical protein
MDIFRLFGQLGKRGHAWQVVAWSACYSHK